MNEKPILFSTPMVQAILDRRKTQTRREITSRNPEMTALLINMFAGCKVEEGKAELLQCNPLYEVGNMLWVRESAKIETGNQISCTYADGTTTNKYFKSYSVAVLEKLKARKRKNVFQPGRFLPKEFARIWLQVTDISIERLNEISQADAVAEGVEQVFGHFIDYSDEKRPNNFSHANYSFFSLWEKINGAESLENNPWVWVVKFKVISTKGYPTTNQA